MKPHFVSAGKLYLCGRLSLRSLVSVGGRYFFGGNMSGKNYGREDAIALLKNKSETLIASGEQRFPRRSDFSEEEVNAIKSFFGPCRERLRRRDSRRGERMGALRRYLRKEFAQSAPEPKKRRRSSKIRTDKTPRVRSYI
jgi:hypothetical protein